MSTPGLGSRPGRLWIVEKPSVARDLVAGLGLAKGAKVVNASSSRADGCYKLSNGDAVTFLFGHLIEPVFLSDEAKAARPEEYFAKVLPIKVADFTYQPKADHNKDGTLKMRDGKPVPPAQYGIVVRLIKAAKEIVNAGDIDREGQLIVDELLLHAGVDPEGGTKPIWRMPLVSNKEEDIAALVDSLERNGDPKWVRRRQAALARQHCDAATGFNASMAYQVVTNYRRMSVGRVQTPVLNLVVERDQQIENFKPTNYYVPVVMMPDGTELRWHKREGAEGMPGFDAEGRIISEVLGRQIVDRIARGAPGTVKQAESVRGRELPPLPFSASVLASTAAKRFGMTPKEAERAAQSLYERHKAISYVGTDCQYLPQSLADDARATLQMLARMYPQQASGANPELRSKAWDDSKVQEHYAIIPTGRLPETASVPERQVYDTVVKRYLAQFYPAHEFIRHQLGVLFGQDEFRSSRREVTRQGWREVEGDLEMGGRDAQPEESETDDDVAVDGRQADTNAGRH